MTQAISRWVPSSTVVTHTGEPVPGDSVFFTAPPPDIGEVYSAHSGWRGNKRAGSGAGSIATIVFVGLLGAVIGGFLGGVFTSGNITAASVGALVGGALFGYAMYRAETRKNAVSYTGAKGIARFIYDASPEKREKGEVLLFANATELRTSQTRNYTNGAYTGTNYAFAWTGRDGKQAHSLSGNYRSEQGTPGIDDPYYYARAAELAWSRYLLQAVNEELNRSGEFRFNLLHGNYVVAGPGFLSLFMKGQQVRCEVSEIAKIEMKQGVLTVRRKDAKDGFLGIGSQGIFKFTYSELANGRVFLMLLDQLVGFSF